MIKYELYNTLDFSDEIGDNIKKHDILVFGRSVQFRQPKFSK
jgi:hypothetical protein